MSVKTIEDVEFGVELPVFEPDTSLDNVGAFARAVGWGGFECTVTEAKQIIENVIKDAR